MMQFVDLGYQYREIKEDLDRRVAKVLAHGIFVSGPEVAELEAQLADFVGVKHCISVSSGTDALLVALMALGVKAGDEVITSPFTFIGTVEAICLSGATPVFVDIRPDTFNMDESQLEAAITERTKAILPVSIFGQCPDFDQINAIAARADLPVIEDAAQSFGATYKQKKSCGLTTIGCTSFFPSKPLGAYGDGGACFCDNDRLADIMRSIRIHGQTERYLHERLGFTGRLDTIQAAVLLAKLQVFEKEITLRQGVAAKYDKLLKDLGSKISTPFIDSSNSSAFAQYTIEVQDRDIFRSKMEKEGVPTAVHYPIPVHKQPVLSESDCEENLGTYPVTEAICQRVVSLPMHPYLTSEELETVSNSVKKSINQ